MDAIKQSLMKKWCSLTYPPLISLRELLLSWDVVSIEECGMVQLLKPGANEQEAGSCFFVCTSIDDPKLNTQLSRFPQHPNSCFAEFMRHFAGLAEARDGEWSFVSENEQWRTLKDGYGGDFEGLGRIWPSDSKNKRDYDIWKDAFYFYIAGSNDVLLLHQDDRVAWWVMGDAVARPVADSFGEFVTMYVALRSQGLAPDSDVGPYKE